MNWLRNIIRLVRRTLKMIIRRSSLSKLKQTPVDKAVSALSLMDEVVHVRQNSDGSLTIHVRGSIQASYGKIVRTIKLYSPSTVGEVTNRVAPPPLPTHRQGAN